MHSLTSKFEEFISKVTFIGLAECHIETALFVGIGRIIRPETWILLIHLHDLKAC